MSASITSCSAPSASSAARCAAAASSAPAVGALAASRASATRAMNASRDAAGVSRWRGSSSAKLRPSVPRLVGAGAADPASDVCRALRSASTMSSVATVPAA